MSKHHQNLPGKLDIQRVLVMKWSALGDLVISTAMFSDIRRAFPNAVIDLQTLPSFAALFANDPRFNNVCSIDTRKKMGLWRWLKFVKNKRYDLVFDLQVPDRTKSWKHPPEQLYKTESKKDNGAIPEEWLLNHGLSAVSCCKIHWR